MGIASIQARRNALMLADSQKLERINWEDLTKINEATRQRKHNSKIKIVRIYTEETFLMTLQILVDYIDYRYRSNETASIFNIIDYIKDEEVYVDNMSYFRITTLEMTSKYTHKEADTKKTITFKNGNMYIDKETAEERKERQQTEIDREALINEIKNKRKFNNKQELMDYLASTGADIKQQLIAGEPYISINNSPWLYVYDII